MGQLHVRKILRHHWKERLKISKTANFETDLLNNFAMRLANFISVNGSTSQVCVTPIALCAVTIYRPETQTNKPKLTLANSSLLFDFCL